MIVHTLDTEAKVELGWKLPSCWLAFIVLAGSMQAIGVQKLSESIPALNAVWYSIELSGEMPTGVVVA